MHSDKANIEILGHDDDFWFHAEITKVVEGCWLYAMKDMAADHRAAWCCECKLIEVS